MFDPVKNGYGESSNPNIFTFPTTDIVFITMTSLVILLEKTSDLDKDERYMATNDILNELGKDIQLDERMEKIVCQAILRRLDDRSAIILD